MPSPRLLPAPWRASLAAPLLVLSSTMAFSSVPGPQVQPNPDAQSKAREQAVRSAIALVHDGAGFSGELPNGTFSDGKPDSRQEIAQAVRGVPEVVRAAVKWLDPTTPKADRVNEAGKLRMATLAGEHSFRRALAWYEPLLLETAADMPEPKLTPEQLKGLRTQIREWKAKSATFREWARNKGGDPKVDGQPKPGTPQSRGPFSDVPIAHPAYGAVQVLASAGVFTGYPDNTFSGKRALTRYEFAVALQRMVQDIQRAVPPRKNMGDGGNAVRSMSRTLPFANGNPPLHLTRGPIGPGAVTSPNPSQFDPAQLMRELTWLRALSEEFDTELAMLGADVQQLRKNLETLEPRIEGPMKLQPLGKNLGTETGSTL